MIRWMDEHAVSVYGIGCLILLVLWIVLASIAMYGESMAIKVLSVDGRKAVIQPYVAPTLDVEVQSGKPGTYLEGCQQVVTDRRFQDHVETVVTLSCEHDVVLEVKGLHLQ